MQKNRNTEEDDEKKLRQIRKSCKERRREEQSHVYEYIYLDIGNGNRLHKASKLSSLFPHFY